ncbi:MAG: cellulase family glycosylhydrolase [Pseudomonadota bacterium]
MPVFTAATAELDVTIRDSWGSGLVADFALTPSEALNGWRIAFDYPGEIVNIWNAQIVSKTGNRYVVEAVGYNAAVAAGATISFGFQGEGSSDEITPIRIGSEAFGDADDSDMAVPVLPTVAIADAVAVEEDGEIGFQLTLSEAASGPVTVSYDTQSGSATAGSDFTPAAGNVVFAAGQTTATVRIALTDDDMAEATEQFQLSLTASEGADLVDASATGRITDGDPWTAPNPTPSPPPSGGLLPDGPLSTAGNQIVDATGTPVQIRAVNWFGAENNVRAPHGLWARPMTEMMDQMVAEGFNAIRLPFSVQNILEDLPATSVAGDPSLQGLTTLEIFDRIIAYAEDIGIKIILDAHRVTQGDGAEGIWYSGQYDEADWIEAWQILGNRYGTSDAIIGADLLNEPHLGTWGTGQRNDWAAAAETAGNAVLEVAPDWLILVEGIGTYQGNNYWWGGQLQGVRDRPVVLNADDKLVYSPHDYPASIFQQPWFTDGSNLYDVFREHWGFIFEEGIAPVLLGEFGSRLQNPLDLVWAEAITDYLSGDFDGDGVNDLPDGSFGPSFAWWSWNPNSGDTGGYVLDDWTTVREGAADLLGPLLDGSAMASDPLVVDPDPVDPDPMPVDPDPVDPDPMDPYPMDPPGDGGGTGDTGNTGGGGPGGGGSGNSGPFVGGGQTYVVGQTSVVTGFDPARDVLDLGPLSIHNQIPVDTADGFMMLHMFNAGLSTLVEGVWLADLHPENFAPIADAHLQQDLSAVLAYEDGSGFVRPNTVYIRSHEEGLVETVDFNPATDKVSFFYLSVRGDSGLNFQVEDTSAGARFFNPLTGQSLTLNGVSFAELDSSHFEWRANQLEDNIAGRMGLTDLIDGFSYGAGEIFSGKSVAMAGGVDRAPYHSGQGHPEYTGTPIGDDPDIVDPTPVDPDPVDPDPVDPDPVDPDPVDPPSDGGGQGGDAPTNGTVELVLDDWGEGFVARFLFTPESAVSGGWTARIATTAEIVNVWNAEIVSHVDGVLTVRNASWTSSIAPGETLEVGIQGSGSSAGLGLIDSSIGGGGAADPGDDGGMGAGDDGGMGGGDTGDTGNTGGGGPGSGGSGSSGPFIGGGQTYVVDQSSVVTGFDPARDVLDLGPLSIHNQIPVDTPDGFMMLHMFNAGLSTLVEGVWLADLHPENFAPIADAHLQQDLSAVLAYEDGSGFVRPNTVYIRSHEEDLVETVDFNPATDKVSFFYLSVRGDGGLNFQVEDTSAGARFLNPLTGQSLTLSGVSFAELDSSHFEWRANQLEDNIAGRMGLTDLIDGFSYGAGEIFSGKSVAMAGGVDRAPYHSGQGHPEYTGTPIGNADQGDPGDSGTGDQGSTTPIFVTVTGGTVTEADPGVDHVHDDGSSHVHDDGHRFLTFQVTLAEPASEEITLNYTTSDGTAVADTSSDVAWDYHTATGTLVFAPGEQTKLVPVSVHPDTLVEETETFTLSVSGDNITGVLEATGTILDDDGADHGDMGDGGMDHGGGGHGDMGDGGMDHGGGGHGDMGDGGMDHGDMGDGGMGHGDMGDGSHDHGGHTDPAPAVIGEAGIVTFKQPDRDSWIRVDFASEIENAAVIMGPATANGEQPLTIRVRSVDETGFEVQIEEWAYIDGGHGTESISWLAVSEGTHTLADGRHLHAGTTTADHTRATQTFDTALGDGPVVLAQVTSDNGDDPVATRLSDVDSRGFDFRLQEEEAADGVTATESLAWVAVETGSDGLLAGRTGPSVNRTLTSIDFADGFDDTPAFFAAMQTMASADTATVRQGGDWSADGTHIRIEEERSLDGETRHAGEDVGYLALETGLLYGTTLDELL